MYVISLAQRSIKDKSIPEIRYDTIPYEMMIIGLRCMSFELLYCLFPENVYIYLLHSIPKDLKEKNKKGIESCNDLFVITCLLSNLRTHTLGPLHQL